MPTFKAGIADSQGRISKRIITAESRDAAIRLFQGSAETLISLEETGDRTGSIRTGFNKKKTLLDFTEMMELFTEAGLSLKDALEISASIGTASGAHAVSARLLEGIHKGKSFAQSVETLPSFFPAIYRGMIRVGDRIGSVERIFPRLRAYLSSRKAISDKLAGALAYPLFVLAVTVGGMIALSLFVLPQMEGIFSGFGSDATAAIRQNLSAIRFGFSLFLAVLVLAGAGTGALLLARRRNNALAVALDGFLLRLPVAGKFISSWETLNLAFAMETLASGGVPVETCLLEAAGVIGNAAFREGLLRAREEVIKGGSLSASFARRREFPSYLTQWLAAGERSGKTEKVFSQLRAFYQSEIDRLTTGFMALIEPALILVIGIFMLIVVTLIVLPLFSMYGTLLQ